MSVNFDSSESQNESSPTLIKPDQWPFFSPLTTLR